MLLGSTGRSRPDYVYHLSRHENMARIQTRVLISNSSPNNIWVNDTLYSIYSDLLLNTVLPVLNVQVPTIKVAPLNETNRLHPTNTTFLRTYICNVRRMKAPLPAIVSIIVSEYAFVKGGYSFFLFLATLYEKTKGRERKYPLNLEIFQLTVRELLRGVQQRRCSR